MAQFKNDPFPGTDYGQYLSWKPIQMPGGQVFYEVPGFPGYVYDPVASNATGRKTFRANPQQQIDQVKQQEKLAKQQEFNQSPAGQLIPVGSSIAGAYTAAKFAQPGVQAVQVLNNGSVLMSDGTVKAAQALGDAAAQGASQAGTQVVAQEGGQIAAQQAGQQAATQGGTQLAGSSSVPLSPGYMGPTPFYVPFAAAVGTYLAGKSINDQLQGKEADKSAQGKVGRAQAAWTTMGGSEISRMFGIGGQNTKEAQQKRWSGLVDKGVAGAAEQQKINQQVASSDMAGKMIGADGKVKKWNFDEAIQQVKSGQTDQFRGVAGNFEAIENWGTLTPEQQNAAVKALADADQYRPDHGSVLIKDKTKAQEIVNGVMKGFQVGAQTAATPAAPIVVTPAQAAAAGANQQKFVKPILKIT